MAKLTIYYSKEKPLVAVGKNQCNMLKFAFKYQVWHSYSNDRATMRALNGLERRGCIKVDRERKMFVIAW